MKIAVVGTGYVGLVTGACLADLGHHVVCVDKDPRKLAVLNRGEIPIYEPGLADVVARCREAGRLSFTDDLPGTVRGVEVAFVAVGTPPAPDGSADLSGVYAVAEAVADAVAGPLTLVIKSTVPVGTADRVRQRIEGRSAFRVDVVSNPEFLAEGTAVDDFMRPDRIVVGHAGADPGAVMDRLYAPLVRTGRPILHMDNRSAEIAKYAANAMLATRITFMNEVANLCDAVGADVEMVRRAVASDQRIGSRFLFPGCGYGGSCFPKDVQAFVHAGVDADCRLMIATAVHNVNEGQKRILGRKVRAALAMRDWTGKRIALWGLAFKPRTDDVREAPSLVFAEEALSRGATVVAYDPEAAEQARLALGDHPRMRYVDDALFAVEGADVLVIATEWPEFRSPDFDALARLMRRHVIVDGRNLYEPADVARAGFDYYCIGRPAVR